MSRSKRMTMEETVRVSDWIKTNENYVNENTESFEVVCRRILEEVGIETTPVAIERLSGKRQEQLNTVGVTKKAMLQLLESVENLYDELGEERHGGLAEARKLIS